MKLWITAIALMLLSGCGAGADLIGTWSQRMTNITGGTNEIRMTFQPGGAFSQLSSSRNLETGCLSENAYDSTFDVSGDTVRINRPTTTRHRQTGCTNQLANYDWTTEPYDSPFMARFIRYRVEGSTLTLGELSAASVYQRVVE